MFVNNVDNIVPRARFFKRILSPIYLSPDSTVSDGNSDSLSEVGTSIMANCNPDKHHGAITHFVLRWPDVSAIWQNLKIEL